ncbi:MAG TPA: proton-conducting transporter membrane subunit [Candidatus Dormibacteraeota bacterium]|nr:proton-conducting transporter membrane subunit [Candidatus Dormibacteraeota bacterium]
MRNAVLVPEALVVAAAVLILLSGRFSWLSAGSRRRLPAVAAGVAIVAFGLELWVGATLSTYFGGALIQDRFALFAKAAVLLAAALAIASADWTTEDSTPIGVAMPLLAAFGVMVAASAGDLVALWAGLELAAAAGVVMVSLRRPDLALRSLIAGGLASALVLMGIAYLYATTGNQDIAAIRAVLLGSGPSVALAIPIVLLLSGLAMRASLAPFQLAGLPAGLGASPLGAGLVVGLIAAGAAVVAIKLAAALLPIPAVYSPYLEVLAAVAMVGGGAAALAVRAPRNRLAYLAAGQVGWLVAGLVTHYRTGVGASLFLLGAFVVAATCGPAVLGRAEGGEAAIAGLGALRPARAAALALAMLSLAGAPPLAGAFGELAVAAALAQSGHFALLALGALGWIMGIAAALSTLRTIYLQSPLEEGHRGAASALPVLTRLSSLGALALCFVIVAYGLFGSPIMGLADQGAEALGLR